jgi:hypothetical protein
MVDHIHITQPICELCTAPVLPFEFVLVHPEILTTYIEGSLPLQVSGQAEAELREDLHGLKPGEAAVLMLLQARLSMTLENKLGESAIRLGPCNPPVNPPAPARG